MITPAADSAASALLLPGFEYRRIDVEDVTISCAVNGAGPPLLLLHGYPQNHLTWRHVAPTLAEDHTVVLADLRGYGGSGKPAPDTAGLVYSKRSMARDQVSLMHQLGFGQFQLASHDRGARVAHRLVLDHPGARGDWIPGLPGGDDSMQVPQDRGGDDGLRLGGVSLFCSLLVRCW